MNFLKKAICVALIAGSAGAQASTSAFEAESYPGIGSNDTIATAQNLGAVVNGTDLNVIGARFDIIPGIFSFPGGSSVDYYSFLTSSTLNVSISVTTPEGATLGNDPMLGLFNSSGVRIAENDDISFTNFDSLLSAKLGAGTYYVVVTGFKETSGQLDFSGPGDTNWPYVLNITAAPVPEPESYAMLLAGLGVIGAIARRRKAA